MDHPQHLSALQVDITTIFFALEAAQGYLVVGGAALLARDLITPPTADLDLFTATPTTSVTPARDTFRQALKEAGYGIAVIQEAPTFCRMVIT